MALRIPSDDEEDPTLFLVSKNTGYGLETTDYSKEVQNWTENRAIKTMPRANFANNSDIGATIQSELFAISEHPEQADPSKVSGANIIIPRDWDGQQITFTIIWHEGGAGGTGNMLWKVAWMIGRVGSLISTFGVPAGDSGINMLQAVSGNADQINKVSFTTTGEVFKEGDVLALEVSRESDVAQDTYNSTAFFMMLIAEVKE